MNDHNLDDLIIDNIEPKNNKTKSLLTIVALLIVVFIVAIILTSIVLEDPKSDTLVLEENDTEMVSPELTLQHVTKPKKAKEGPKLTEIIEDQLNKGIQAPKITEEVGQKEKPAPVKAKERKPVVKEPKIVEEESKSVKITKEFSQTLPKPEVSSVPKKEIAASAVNKGETVVLNPKSKKETVKATASGISYYIQVGSFSQTPSKRFLSVIENSGFKYYITKPNAKGSKKLLIGPYPDKSSVDNALVRVRDHINKSAFVVKK